MQIIDYDPANGQAFQGDVAIIPIPAGIKIATVNEMRPIDGKLILQEGERTGHHHHIVLRERNFRPATRQVDPVLHVRDTKLRRAFAGSGRRRAISGARMYRDPKVATEMQRMGLLTRTDLAVGCLVVEGAAVVIAHQEHDGIRVAPGKYLIGRQVEGDGAVAERFVED